MIVRFRNVYVRIQFAVGAVLAVACGLALSGAPAVYASGNAPAGLGSCHAVQLPVALGEGQPFDQYIHGTLCTPHFWYHGHRQIDLLLHGATYNSGYWNFPYKTAAYSWVNDTLAAGRAVFYYDNIGTGSSSRPSSTAGDLNASAYILHQVIGWLHGGANHYEKVMAVGHSYGSIIIEKETSMYNDASGIVLTGYAHALNPNVLAILGTGLYPANQDPQFQGQTGLDDGWVTTRPGVRSQLFYSAIADPGVKAYDEAHKEVVSQPAFEESIPQMTATPATSIAQQIVVPVMVQNGTQDAVFCGGAADCSTSASFKAYEAQFYTHAASLDASVIPLTGHSITLHPTVLAAFAAVNQWIRQQ